MKIAVELALEFPNATIMEIAEAVASDRGNVSRQLARFKLARNMGDKKDFDTPETRARVASMRDRADSIRRCCGGALLELDAKIVRFCCTYGWEAGVSEFGLYPETAKTLELEALRAKQGEVA